MSNLLVALKRILPAALAVVQSTGILNREVMAQRTTAFILGVLLGAGITYTPAAHAGPIAVLMEQGLEIMIYSEACKLAGAPKNLTNRATWKEKGKTYEGCVAPFGGGAIVGGYFADGTMAVIPAAAFSAVKEL